MTPLLLTLASISTVIGRRIAGRWLTPINAYIFAQVFLLGVAFLKLSPEMTDFHISTWFAIAASMLAFGIGCALGRFEKPEKKDQPKLVQENFEKHFTFLASAIQPFLLISFTIGVYLLINPQANGPHFPLRRRIQEYSLLGLDLQESCFSKSFTSWDSAPSLF